MSGLRSSLVEMKKPLLLFTWLNKRRRRFFSLIVTDSKADGKPPRCLRRSRYRRRAIVLLDVVSVYAYQVLVEQDKVRAPIPCPDGCQGTWGYNDSFTRQWVDYDCVAYTIVIIRVRCSVCRAAWSLFPAFVWYRFRFSYQLVQSTCWQIMEGTTAATINAGLSYRLCPIVEDRGSYRVPAESTIRSWVTWLGQAWLERLIRWTVGFIARQSAELARHVFSLACASRGLPAAAESRVRTRRVLQIGSLLDALKTRRQNFRRKAPNQLRDWARTLFSEQRRILVRPP